MLNGSHSSLAYLGYLAGYEYVAQAIADPAFKTFIHDLMTEEVMPTLGMERDGARDLPRPAAAALRQPRAQPPALADRDGRQRRSCRSGCSAPSAAASAATTRIDRLSLGVAAWMRYVTGIDEKGGAIEVRDPLAERLRKIADGAGRDPDKLAAGLLLRQRGVRR